MTLLLKNRYDEKYIDILNDAIFSSFSNFDTANFKKFIFDTSWNDKELKQRMRHISTTLYDFLPNEFEKSIVILQNTYAKMDQTRSLENTIFQDFVELYGLDHFKLSMNALACFTINSTSEFAIRQFIIKYPTQTITQMKLWATDENHQIRRLASEGCRPRLPWAIALVSYKKDPADILEILDILKDDESLYVRKSVANNLNDISKDNPHILKEIANKWLGIDDKRDWIVKHGCRTLLKNADLDIMQLFGFQLNETLSIDHFIVTDKVKMGEDLDFSFVLRSPENLGKIRIEYALDFVRLNNKSSKKVFKIAEGIYTQKSKNIKKQYSFKPISTRKYYHGIHQLSIIVNGLVLETKKFTLV
ncbi:MAG: DNA alkylation repair protein [Arcobacteraceae bacterium]